jgi:hypothetical protein
LKITKIKLAKLGTLESVKILRVKSTFLLWQSKEDIFPGLVLSSQQDTVS